jgi:hypothetical protein
VTLQGAYCGIKILCALKIITECLNLYLFLKHFVSFTKSLFFDFRVLLLLLLPRLQQFTTRVKYPLVKKEVFMTHCPCCSNQMLRHVRQHQIYWFCRQCWQTMPVYNLNRSSLSPSLNLVRQLGLQEKYYSSANFNSSL